MKRQTLSPNRVPPTRGGLADTLPRHGSVTRAGPTPQQKARPRLHETPVHFEGQTQFG
jgi:hypothetical protein